MSPFLIYTDALDVRHPYNIVMVFMVISMFNNISVVRVHSQRWGLATKHFPHWSQRHQMYIYTSLTNDGALLPPRNDWQRIDPATAGMDQAKIDDAIAWHRTHETKNPRDLRRSHDLSFAREAYGDPLGPFQPRGEPTGVIVRHGHIIAEWR